MNIMLCGTIQCIEVVICGLNIPHGQVGMNLAVELIEWVAVQIVGQCLKIIRK
jgi:hypothetical protein